MREHYRRHLGPPLDVAALHRRVRVLTFRSPFGRGEVVLATDGARRVDADPGRGHELVMLCRPEHAGEAAVLLCDVAHYGREHGAVLAPFHVLPAGVGVVPGSPLTSLLLTMPWFGTAEFFIARVGTQRVDVLHVIPITEPERALFASAGTDALEQALEDADVDLTDFRRASAV